MHGENFNMQLFYNRTNWVSTKSPSGPLKDNPDLSGSYLKMNQMKNYKHGSASLFITDLNFDLN